MIPTDVFPDTNEVLGDGNTPNTWMFVGEAPGADEERSGRPFVGQSGKLLNRLLEYYTQLRRSSVYVTNVVKHRPPNNRTPKVKEIRQYLPYLWDEIRECKPQVIVTLGATASRVFDKKIKITDDHGVARRCEIEGVWTGTLVPWYHPAYALRSPVIFEQLAGDASRLHNELARLLDEVIEPRYELANEDEVVARLLSSWGEFGFDTETTSPTRNGVFATDEAEMVGYSVSWAPYQGVYVPATEIGPGMAGILESPLWAKVCHNAKFEYKILKKLGITLTNYEDTKLAAYLLGEPRTGLKTLTKQYLGVQPITYEDVTHGKQMSELQPDEIADYASADADHTLRLWPTFVRRLDHDSLRGVYERIERPLIPVLASMEARGLCVNIDACNQVSEKLHEAIQEASVLTTNAFSEAGAKFDTFNINSGDQIASILESLGAPLVQRTESKDRFVVNATTLESIREWNPEVIQPLLDYRKYVKLTSYVKNFIELRGPDGRLHTSFNQSGHWEEAGGSANSAPSTGRISSSGPNLQNVPNHRASVGGTDWGHELRTCITASEGNVLLSADLGQEEPRIVAVLAQDQALLDGFANNRDIYRTATEALYPYARIDGSDVEFKETFEHERFVGKTFFLAWYYGAGASRLRVLDSSLTASDVKRGLTMLEEAHPARRDYLDETFELLNTTGYVSSLFGRKRWISKIWSPHTKERDEAMREAANMRVQATAADILKIALPRIHEALEGKESALVSTVHDEVILDTPPSEVRYVTRVVSSAFGDLLTDVDLTLETFIGETWAARNRVELEVV